MKTPQNTGALPQVESFLLRDAQHGPMDLAIPFGARQTLRTPGCPEVFVRLRPDQRQHDLLHERPYSFASIGGQTLPEALPGPKHRFGHRVLQLGGFEEINLPDSVATLLQKSLKTDLQTLLYTT